MTLTALSVAGAGRWRFKLDHVMPTLLLVSLVAMAVPSAALGQDKERVLVFCLANPDACALSVRNMTAGWERHLKPDRPQALASTVKTLTLIAYAQAVVCSLYVY